ncbi:MAG: hypothetical protein AABZ55_15950 [Bdellovibrionota bacterium]
MLKLRPLIIICLILALNLRLAQSDDAKETVITLSSPQEACAWVSSPGDAVLIHTLDSSGAGTEDFSTGIVAWTRAKQILSLNLPTINYRHAEILTEINLPDDLISESFYPFFIRKDREGDEQKAFERHDRNSNFYRTSFDIYRVVFTWDGLGTFYGQTLNREWALQKVARKEDYPGYGTCADFVNWTYNLAISSWWNFVPIVKQIIQLIYPPEAFRAPDDIARSPFTKQVCEVRDNQLVYPQSLRAKKLWDQTRTSLESDDPMISGHARQVKEALIRNLVIDDQGNLLTERIRFEVKSFAFENPFPIEAAAPSPPESPPESLPSVTNP